MKLIIFVGSAGFTTETVAKRDAVGEGLIRRRRMRQPRVVDGAYKGENGSVMSILSIEPNARYLVELESGYDVEVDESCLNTAD